MLVMCVCGLESTLGLGVSRPHRQYMRLAVENAIRRFAACSIRAQTREAGPAL